MRLKLFMIIGLLLFLSTGLFAQNDNKISICSFFNEHSKKELIMIEIDILGDLYNKNKITEKFMLSVIDSLAFATKRRFTVTKNNNYIIICIENNIEKITIPIPIHINNENNVLKAFKYVSSSLEIMRIDYFSSLAMQAINPTSTDNKILIEGFIGKHANSARHLFTALMQNYFKEKISLNDIQMFYVGEGKSKIGILITIKNRRFIFKLLKSNDEMISRDLQTEVDFFTLMKTPKVYVQGKLYLIEEYVGRKNTFI